MLDEAVIEGIHVVLSGLDPYWVELDADQHQAVFQAVEFVLKARVVRVKVHVIQTDTADGLVAGMFRKIRLRAKIDGKKVVRTIALTDDPMEQVLRAFGSFDPKALQTVVHGHQPASVKGIRNLVPKDVWEGLSAQLAERESEYGKDEKAQADLQRRLEVCRTIIFEKDRQALVHEMGRLQRRGWSRKDVMGTFDEAFVREVMES